MKRCRIHIFGASGSGTTTLGRALAQELAFSHHDTDEFYWLPTVPPFKRKRAVHDRIRLMREMFTPRADWILSGSMESWGEDIHKLFDYLIFLQAAADVRVARLQDRERRHFGTDAVSEGGWRHGDTQEFTEWASRYEHGDRGGRTLARHEAWLHTLDCPILRLDGTQPIDTLVQKSLRFVGKDGA